MVVFKYLEDKDVFQKFYSKMLAKRLVQSMSASDDAEASMISKLKAACGFEHTSKLQRMFQDIGVSKDLNENFRKHLSNTTEPLDVDFHIQVRLNFKSMVKERELIVFFILRYCPAALGPFSSLAPSPSRQSWRGA